MLLVSFLPAICYVRKDINNSRQENTNLLSRSSFTWLDLSIERARERERGLIVGENSVLYYFCSYLSQSPELVELREQTISHSTSHCLTIGGVSSVAATASHFLIYHSTAWLAHLFSCSVFLKVAKSKKTEKSLQNVRSSSVLFLQWNCLACKSVESTCKVVTSGWRMMVDHLLG